MFARRFTFIIVVASVFASVASAQTGSCVNDASDPYHVVNDWAHPSRPFAPASAVYVDNKDDVWIVDRCGEKGGCAASDVAPIWELSSQGKVLKNFGAGLFVNPHGVTVDKGGNVWVVDGGAKDGKGMQVTKLSPDGKVLLTLGKAGQSGTGLDVFDKPNSVAIASNGDIFVAEGHRTGAEGQPQTYGNSRIMKFDKNGKFIKTFGHLGTGDGEMLGPHVVAFDSKGRLFVADRANSRIEIFNQDGKLLTSWKQFGRPSGMFISKDDTLYVSDDQSEDKNTSVEWAPPNPGCKRGFRVGSAKTGKVSYFIPSPQLDPALAQKLKLYDGTADAEGIAADSHGTIYAATVRVKTIYKYAK